MKEKERLPLSAHFFTCVCNTEVEVVVAAATKASTQARANKGFCVTASLIRRHHRSNTICQTALDELSVAYHHLHPLLLLSGQSREKRGATKRG